MLPFLALLTFFILDVSPRIRLDERGSDLPLPYRTRNKVGRRPTLFRYVRWFAHD